MPRRLRVRFRGFTTTGAVGAFSLAGQVAAMTRAGAPINVVAPAVSGVVQVGMTLSVSDGSWINSPVPPYSYQWRRNGVAIAGAIGQNHTLVTADAGTFISCAVTASNAVGSTVAVSASVGPILAASSGTATPVTTFSLTSTTTGTHPWAFGHAFKQGDVPTGSFVVGDSTGFQATVKSRWPDDSVKHAIIAGRAALVANTPATITVLRTTTAPTGVALGLENLTVTGITASMTTSAFGSASWSGTDWNSPFLTWVTGPQMSSWIYRKQIGSDAHLVGWLEVRVYDGGAVEVLPWIENGYLLVAGPTNKNATYSFTLGGTQRFSAAFDLPNHCRTPLVSGTALSYWLGTAPDVTPKHSTTYLQSTGLVPTYYATVSPTASIVTSLPSTYTPLQQGSMPGAMGSAGYHGSIGLLPQSDVLYLTSTATTTWSALQRNAYSAGRYGIHYRDEATNRPIRFSQHPQLVMGTGSGITGIGSATSGTTPAASGTSPAAYTNTHAPALGYFAALVTGRFYHVETAQFQATAHYLKNGNVTRNGVDGILQTGAGANTTRGAAWALRTLAQAVAITPSDDAVLGDLVSSMAANVDWYHARYVGQTNNPFGWVTPYVDYTARIVGTTMGGSTSTDVALQTNVSNGNNDYYNGYILTIGGETRTVVDYVGSTRTAIVSPAFTVATSGQSYVLAEGGLYMGATWQQDFFTSAIGLAESLGLPLGASSARLSEFFSWKAKSVAGRFGTAAPGDYLYRDAAPYTIAIAPLDTPDFATGTGPWYASWGETWTATQIDNPTGAKEIGDGSLRGGNIADATSYWGNMMPALSYAIEHGAEGAAAGYERMISAPNWATLLADFNRAPEWGIRPRTLPGLPSWLLSASTYEFVAVPNGQPSTAAGLVPAVSGSMGVQSGITNAWGGAFTDGSRFYIHGGGHADYGGNEIGAIDLTSDAPAWDLLVERTPVAQLLGGSNYYADGKPSSRHTYYGMWYVASLGKMLRFNSDMGFAYNGNPVGGSANVRTADIDAFNLSTNEWEPGAYGPMLVINGSETAMCQDHTTGDCYVYNGANDIYKYTAATNAVSLVANLPGTEGQGGATVFDAANQRLVRFAGRASGKCVYWNIVSGTKVTPTLTGPAASAISGLTGENHGWGIAHDTENNVAYLMTNAGVVLRVRLSDFYVEQVTTTGATPAAPTNGVWGRFKYIQSLRAVAYLANWSSPLLVMKV
jgi:hypothetical protein